MTKLLYVTAAMPFGGGEEFLIAEADELRRQGVALLIVPRSPAGRVVHLDAQALAPLAVRRRLWSPRVIACAACQALRRPRRFVQILSLLQLYPPGKNLLKNLLVLPKGIWLGVLAGRWRADHIHAHWATTTSTMAMIAGHWSGIPWSFTAHRGGIVEENLLGPKAATAAFVRCISRVTQRMLAEKGAVAERVRILHMGVVLPDAPSLPPQQRTSCVVLCPANLLPVKGHEHLLRAMELLKHNGVRCTLRVAGDGALQNKLQCLADELRLGSMVEFLGGVPHDRILEWYRRRLVDAVVLPSVDLGEGVHEGIPVSLMEAMAHGLPVISTTTGGIPELLHDGAGIMTPPKDPAALAEAIERLIRDPDLRTRLGAAGRKRIEEEFAVQSVVEKLLAEIEAA